MKRQPRFTLDISADNGTQDVYIDLGASTSGGTKPIIHASSWKGVNTSDMVGNTASDTDTSGSAMEIGTALTGGGTGDVIYCAGSSYNTTPDVDRNGQTKIAETTYSSNGVGSAYKAWGGVDGNDWAFYGEYPGGAGLVINVASAGAVELPPGSLATLGVGV